MSKIEISINKTKSGNIIINNYKIIERIGVGSYGRIYKAKKNNQIYVLKEIPIDESEEKIQNIKNEANLLASLNNKFVVKYYESFQIDQNIYIVMEYCEGGDLCTYITMHQKESNNNFKFEEDLIWKLFIQISLGLFYIHSKKIVHRDIKSLNIFLTKNMDGKIGDLGIAKLLEDTKFAKTFVGTPYYVSPEMCKNKPYNEKSDIWALGCLLYEMITLNHPFRADNQAALFIKILHSNYKPLPVNTSQELKNMVKFILQKNEIKRPSMKEIISQKSFVMNAKRLGLGNDVKEVLSSVKNNLIKYNTSYRISLKSKNENTLDISNLNDKKIGISKIKINIEDKSIESYKKNNSLESNLRKSKLFNKNIRKTFKNINNINSTSKNKFEKDDKKSNREFLRITPTDKISIKINTKSISQMKNKKKKQFLEKSTTDNQSLINEEEFLKVLENTIKNNPIIVNINQLNNYQFDGSKNLDTTSETTSIGKIDNGLLSLEEMYSIYNSDKSQNEKKPTNFSNGFEKLNFMEKIHKDKKDLKKIIASTDMSELVKDTKICKAQYRKILKEIEKYNDIINLDEIRNNYTVIGELSDLQLNQYFNEIVSPYKKLFNDEEFIKVANILYNLICYETKYDIILKKIKKKNFEE